MIDALVATFSGLQDCDENSLGVLTGVLGLWFKNPQWELLAPDEGAAYVLVSDTVGELSVIIAEDDLGTYRTETSGHYAVPEVTGSSVSEVALKMASTFTALWIGIGAQAARLLRRVDPYGLARPD